MAPPLPHMLAVDRACCPSSPGSCTLAMISRVWPSHLGTRDILGQLLFFIGGVGGHVSQSVMLPPFTAATQQAELPTLYIILCALSAAVRCVTTPLCMEVVLLRSAAAWQLRQQLTRWWGWSSMPCAHLQVR